MKSSPILPGMGKGPRLLREWIVRQRFNQMEAAAFLRLDDASFSYFITGKRRPSLERAVMIEHKTGIPVASWVSRRRYKRDAPVVTQLARAMQSQTVNDDVSK